MKLAVFWIISYHYATLFDLNLNSVGLKKDKRFFLEKLTLGDIAPDFSLPDHEGKMVNLSDLFQDHHVLLVFNLGFA